MPSSTAFYRLVALSQPVSLPRSPRFVFSAPNGRPRKPKIRAQPVPASPEPTSFARGAASGGRGRPCLPFMSRFFPSPTMHTAAAGRPQPPYYVHFIAALIYSAQAPLVLPTHAHCSTVEKAARHRPSCKPSISNRKPSLSLRTLGCRVSTMLGTISISFILPMSTPSPKSCPIP